MSLCDEIIGDVRRYFSHQRELYGREIILENPALLKGLNCCEQLDSLTELRHKVESCTMCDISKSRKNIVFGEGNEKANLMLVGEAPGREEDIQGRPFVGMAGQLLDRILQAIGFERDEVYICNILKCRPPNNRDPNPDEIDRCLPFLLRQIDFIKPRLILTLGRIAAQILLRKEEPLNRLRGKIHDYNKMSLIVTYHPAALLRNPQWKRLVWEDVKMLREWYDENVGDKPKWHPPRKQ